MRAVAAVPDCMSQVVQVAGPLDLLGLTIHPQSAAAAELKQAAESTPDPILACLEHWGWVDRVGPTPVAPSRTRAVVVVDTTAVPAVALGLRAVLESAAAAVVAHR